MAALTKQRNTKRLGTPGEVILGSIDCPLKALAVVYQGGMVALDLTTGYFIPASAAVNQVIVGRFNTGRSFEPSLTGSAANGGVIARVEQGIFCFNNGDTITQAHVGWPCYASDDNTVNKSDASGVRPYAGRIVAVDSTGVYVMQGMQTNTLEDMIRGSAEQISSAGALALTKPTQLTVSGTKAYTLAAGLWVGHSKKIFCKSAVSTPVGTVTLTGGNGITTLTFSASPAFIELLNGTSGWDVVGYGGTVTIA